MARRYMIDSILYWAQEYHIDGFRFDLMGLYDVETINAVRAALDTLPGGRDILMYGEPWQGGDSQLHRYEANKANLAMLNDRIGIFCDDTRDTIKGGCFNAREPGYVEGRPGSFWDIGGAVAAWCRSDRLPPHAPSQIVNYISAHDNFTLWDKLLLVRYEKPEFTAADGTALAQNRLAAGIYLTSFGLPFLQAGEEFARTKKREGQQLPLFACAEPAGLGAGRKNIMHWWTTTAACWLCGQGFRGFPAPTPTRRMPCTFSHWSSRWWAGSCPPNGTTAQHGRRCACSITPPRPARPCRCRLGAGRC